MKRVNRPSRESEASEVVDEGRGKCCKNKKERQGKISSNVNQKESISEGGNTSAVYSTVHLVGDVAQIERLKSISRIEKN